MNLVHIVTDSMVHYTKPSFTGQDLVTVVPYQIHYRGTPLSNDVKLFDLPGSIANHQVLELTPPTVEEYLLVFEKAILKARDIIVLPSSSFITSSFQNAKAAAHTLAGKSSIHIIDTLAISSGLGFLVQQAALDASRNLPCFQIENQLRYIIPHIYSLLCIPNLTYLKKAGFLDEAQAIVGEMLNLIPLFTLEDGHLSPLEKARNPRQLLDFFEEFMGEFCDLSQIAFIQGAPPLTSETRLLREKAQIAFPKTQFAEYNISLPVAALFGPRSVSMFIMENPDQN